MATWLPYKTACVSIINVLVIDSLRWLTVEILDHSSKLQEIQRELRLQKEKKIKLTSEKETLQQYLSNSELKILK